MRHAVLITPFIATALIGCRPAQPILTVYPTREACEQATGRTCQFQQCDYVPSGKTVEEVCGKGLRKGWVPTAPPAAPAGWGSYTSYGLGPSFRLGYPKDWTVVEGPDVQNVNHYVGTPVVQVKTPVGYQAGTNLVGVSVTVSQTSEPTAVVACAIRVESLRLPFPSEIPPTGAFKRSPWAVVQYDGAAAGSRYNQTIYRRRSGDACVELLATIQSGEISNYPTTVREFDREPISALLERIVAGFEFLNE